MTYTPINWQNGDTITAEKLNNAEQGIVDAQNGWEVTTNTLFSESITTAGSSPAPVANLAYTTLISVDPLTVTFEGTDYTPPVTEMGGSYAYGDMGGSGPDFTNYPFCIISTGAANMVYTETAGTYSISASVSSAATTANFDMAAQAAVGGMAPLQIVLGTTTWQEAYDAMSAGRMAFVDRFSDQKRMQPVLFVDISNYSIRCVNFVGDSLTISAYYAASADSVIDNQ